jgi:hypothetical protein
MAHDLPDQFQPDLILGLAENAKSAITPEQMIGSSSNFYQRYI